MNFEVIEKATGTSEIMSDKLIEQRFGPVGFTQMVADVHDTHSAVDIGHDMGDDDFMGVMEDMDAVDDIMGDFDSLRFD